MKDLLEHIREVGLAQREGIKIDQGWDRWEMISLIFMSRFKLIVHRDRDIFGLCRAGLKRGLYTPPHVPPETPGIQRIPLESAGLKSRNVLV